MRKRVQGPRCASIPLLLLLSAGGVGGGCCDEASRRYEVDAPDDALATMVEACQAELASTCAGKAPAYCAPQACVDVCNRVMTIAGDDPHGLEKCFVYPATPPGVALEVIVISCG